MQSTDSSTPSLKLYLYKHFSCIIHIIALSRVVGRPNSFHQVVVVVKLPFNAIEVPPFTAATKSPSLLIGIHNHQLFSFQKKEARRSLCMVTCTTNNIFLGLEEEKEGKENRGEKAFCPEMRKTNKKMRRQILFVPF